MRNALASALLLLVVVPSAWAQSNEIGFGVGIARYEAADFDDELGFTVEFEDEKSIEAHYTRHWTPNFGTEFGIQRLIGAAEATDGEISQGIGDVNLTVLSAIAQWRFNPSSNIVPYIGGGIATTGGELDIDDDLEDPEEGAVDVDFENETNFILNAGVEFRVSPAVGVSFDTRYTPFNAKGEDDPLDPGIDVNPLSVMLGVRFHF